MTVPPVSNHLVQAASPPPSDLRGEEVALVDLLDRLLAGGVVLTGEVTISLAGVDLVHLSLRVLVSSVASLAVRK